MCGCGCVYVFAEGNVNEAEKRMKREKGRGASLVAKGKRLSVWRSSGYGEAFSSANVGEKSVVAL